MKNIDFGRCIKVSLILGLTIGILWVGFSTFNILGVLFSILTLCALALVIVSIQLLWLKLE